MGNEETNVITRPPIGFIVEGAGEYYSYPSIVTKITKQKGYRIPIVNTFGFGGILKGLHGHLDDLVRTDHPYSVIITIDLRDVRREGLFTYCVELYTHITDKVQDWQKSRSQVPTLLPLPNQIQVVIQIQVFESWLISDLEGLRNSQLFAIDENLRWQNVDDEISNPCDWIESHRTVVLNIKNPMTVKKLVSNLFVGNMSNSSKSFNKFYREVEYKYRYWGNAVAQQS